MERNKAHEPLSLIGISEAARALAVAGAKLRNGSSPCGVCGWMVRVAFIVSYLGGTAAAVFLLNANNGDEGLAFAIWAVTSLLLGWGTGNLAFALLAFLAIPFAVPFGNPDHYEFSEPLPIWWTVAIASVFSAALILFGALVKRVVNDWCHQRV